MLGCAPLAMPGRFLFIRSLLSPHALAVALGLFALSATACTPKIGDKCVLSTDCSTQGDRQCDTSMPGGYCTVYNCGPNSCPDYAACYLFHPEVQGCDYNDRETSRTSKSFCMAGCQTNSDCRTDYICADGRGPPWYALLLDDNQNQKVCLPDPDTTTDVSQPSADAQAPVCQAFPDIDAAFPVFPSVDAAGTDAGDAGVVDAGGDATVDGGRDAGLDATVDASDAGSEDAAPE